MSEVMERAAETGGVSAERLRSIVERIERLDIEKKALSDDIKDIFTEASSAGFDKKIIRQLIRMRAQDPKDLEEAEHLLDTYRRALGV